MQPQEALGYNRHGLRCISQEETEALRRLILSHTFGKTDTKDKSLKNHQEIAKEIEQLDKTYQDFFQFPDSDTFLNYQKQRKELIKEYHEKKYQADIKILHRDLLLSITGTYFLLMPTLSFSKMPVIASLCCVAATLYFYRTTRRIRKLFQPVAISSRNKYKLTDPDLREPIREGSYKKTISYPHFFSHENEKS